MSIQALIGDFNPWWQSRNLFFWKRLRERRTLHGHVLTRLGVAGGRRAHVIIGPRQVGKTVILRQLIEDLMNQGWPPANVTYFDFSDERLTSEVSPRDVAGLEPPGIDPRTRRVFLFDEIGRSAGWNRWLKQAVDTTPHLYVVTDSAARILRSGGQESGVGRWDEHVLEPLTFPEFVRFLGVDPADAFQVTPNPFERFLAVGGFPEFAFAEPGEVRERLRADVAERAILRDLARENVEVERALRLFVYLVQDSGAIFDARRRARDLDADPRPVGSWLDLLLDTFYLHRLDSRHVQATARLRAKSKIYAADHSLILAFAPIAMPLRDPGVRSRVFEALVYRHLREFARQRAGRLTYWRENDDFEIDFVADAAKGLVAIEVTSSSDVRSDKIGRVRQATARLRAKRTLLVHGGTVGQMQEGIELVPIHEFLLKSDELLIGEKE